MEIKAGQTSTRVDKTPMSKKMKNPQDKNQVQNIANKY